MLMIDLIVGSAVLLTALYCWFWLRDPQLRARIEAPKHVFLANVLRHNGHHFAEPAESDRSQSP